ncbi:core-2/I-branching enzyme-domain-containing protein [Entophlyctis helioformis]|nr:core-2/I-branching enzyme-domain-containing protein [Entophlyctis helioformis]
MPPASKLLPLNLRRSEALRRLPLVVAALLSLVSALLFALTRLHPLSPEVCRQPDPLPRNAEADALVVAEQALAAVLDQARSLRNGPHGPHVGLQPVLTLRGFRFCSPLEGSSFHANLVHQAFGGSLNSLPPTQRRSMAIALIDAMAEVVFTRVSADSPARKPLASQLLRYSCFMAAHANNTLVNHTSSQWLARLDAPTYFPMFTFDASSPAIAETLELSHGLGRASKKCTLKPHYKIVFSYLIHERSDILRRQFEALYDKDSLFVFHIDRRQSDFHFQVVQWIMTEFSMRKRCNVIVLSNRFPVFWGHSSIVQAQLESAFQALELASWDYIINLSAYDYPLKTPADMYKELQADPGKSYIQFWPEGDARRLGITHMTHHSETYPLEYDNFVREYPFAERYPPRKHHQWMILSRRFIETLRTDPDAMILWAWMEHTLIPDEAFYGTWALAPGNTIRNDVIDDMRRFVDIRLGDWHPSWLNISFTAKFTESHFLVRKMDPLYEIDLAEWMDDRRLHVTSWPNATESTMAV